MQSEIFEGVLIYLSGLLGLYLGYRLVMWLVIKRLLFRFGGVVLIVMAVLGCVQIKRITPPDPIEFYYGLMIFFGVLGIVLLLFDRNIERLLVKKTIERTVKEIEDKEL